MFQMSPDGRERLCIHQSLHRDVRLPYYAVTMDSIMTLPVTLNGHDCILTITDKATKAIRLTPGVSGKDGDADDPNKPDDVPGDAQY
jgi:hypothetical protein